MQPGVKVNLCACNMVTLWSPAYGDLELEKFGLDMLTSSEWGMFHPFKDRSAVMFNSFHAQKTYEHFKSRNEHDAEIFKTAFNIMGPMLGDTLMGSMFGQAMQGPEEMVAAEGLGSTLRMIIPEIPENVHELNGLELAEAIYHDDKIRTAILGNCIMAGSHPWDRGMATLMPIVFPIMQSIQSVTWTCRGGSHSLVHALASCFAYHGGRMFTGCPVDKMIVENGEAKGIVLSKHAIFPEAEVRARRAVVSNLSCHPTFKDLIGEEKLPDWVKEGVDNYKNDETVLFCNYWVLDKPPHWEGYPEEINDAYGFNFGLESCDDIRRLEHCLENDLLPDPPIVSGLSVQGFALADPTQAPKDQYTVMAWSNVPYKLPELGGPEKWDQIRESYGDKVDALLREYNPGMMDSVIDRYCNSPLDYYRKNPSQVMGSTTSGATSLKWFGTARPFPGCGAPRTPFGNLYLSNSIWPFGTTNLGAGYVAASIIAEDLGVREGQDWWRHKNLESGVELLKRRGIEIDFNIP
ncbi:MAG: NAD(P)/FAD-dependent oxidoreductase [Deltaproteobacteria bacterium]|nr:NAD(P)/FAD-dependent oxidoreductase [Deltaproteobacteria bacterium]